jgi:hypothetical protein
LPWATPVTCAVGIPLGVGMFSWGLRPKLMRSAWARMVLPEYGNLAIEYLTRCLLQYEP